MGRYRLVQFILILEMAFSFQILYESNTLGEKRAYSCKRQPQRASKWQEKRIFLGHALSFLDELTRPS